MVISNVIYDLYVSLKDYIVNKYGIYMKSVYLTWKTWDLIERWTENVSKCKIELKSVYLTIVTWDLTERWTENVSKYKIELKSVYVTW